MTVLLYVGQLKVTAEHGGMGARAEERVRRGLERFLLEI